MVDLLAFITGARTVPCMPQGYRHQWTDEQVAMLGTVPDFDIAKALGISKVTVKYHRDKRGIPPYKAPPTSIKWSDSDIADLGTVPDHEIALRMGIHEDTARKKRVEIGLSRRPGATFVDAYEWSDEADALLGTTTDRAVAEKIGVSPGTVNIRRNKLGILPFGKPDAPTSVDLSTVLPEDFPVEADGRWWVPCPSCDKFKSFGTVHTARKSVKLNAECKTCAGARKTARQAAGEIRKGGSQRPPKLHKGVRISWFNKFRKGADMRGIAFEITLDDVAELLALQESKCALSGFDISGMDVGDWRSIRASIDRIDSSGGYTVDNIQIVDRDVNICKQSKSQEDFIQLCNRVARTHRR